jgi:hypothetical protein
LLGDKVVGVLFVALSMPRYYNSITIFTGTATIGSTHEFILAA